MTATPILEQLASEFSSTSGHMSTVLELLDAGLSAPYIGRIRREETGGLSETMIRRIEQRRSTLEELDRRRGTILRMLEASGVTDPSVVDEIGRCMDPAELEDLFIPHRRPEPEVQLALDRGLGALADEIVRPVARPESRDTAAEEGARGDASEANDGETEADGGDAADPQTYAGVEASDAGPAESQASDPTDAGAASPSDDAAAPSTEGPTAEAANADDAPKPDAPSSTDHETGALSLRVELTPRLAKLCEPYVNPDRGVHSEEEALSGATRILSDRVGRDAKLRGVLRRMMRKQGRLSVRATVDEKGMGRHRALLKVDQPLRQLQGHRLIGIRQAQKERVLTTVLSLDHDKSFPRVRAALGKRNHPDFDALLDAVADRALRARLLPAIEEDVRLELKERGDDEALRLLAQHLRQVLLAPPGARVAVAGLDVNAKHDWTIAVVDREGRPTGVTGKIETADKAPPALGAELKELLGETDVRVIAVGHGKAARAATPALRAAVSAAELDIAVCIANEVGLSNYANSELARKELPDHTVPTRMAIGLARRYKDPLVEMVKVDARSLRLGPEQGLVSKASLRRTFQDVIESCVAHAGCDVNTAPLSQLKHVPGVGHDMAVKLIARREQEPFKSRDELRTEGLLTEAQWTSAAAFLRVRGGPDPLDATGLHPDQYALARRVAAAGGGSLEDVLGRVGATKGLRRADFDVDDATWRDLMRELAHPGRDPRIPNAIPALTPADTDPATLARDQVVEGIVFNVASFGAFVDLGLAKDGMIHISEVSDRYVRDARELLSIGQTVRCRVLDPSGQRISLSLKKVPFRAREGGARGRGGRGARGRAEGGRERGGRFAQKGPETFVRAARTRRDGLAGARRDDRGRGGGGGGGRAGGGGRGGPGRGAGRYRGDNREEPFDRKLVQSDGPGYNPFATFFDKDRKRATEAAPADDPESGSEATSESSASRDQAGSRSSSES